MINTCKSYNKICRRMQNLLLEFAWSRRTIYELRPWSRFKEVISALLTGGHADYVLTKSTDILPSKFPCGFIVISS